MRAIWVCAFIAGCGSRVESVDGDAEVRDTFVADIRVDTLVDTFVATDTTVADTATESGPDRSQFPVTEAQAKCLGVTRPECAGCHFRGGTWYMRPRDVPPPPPSIPPADYAGCGVTPP